MLRDDLFKVGLRGLTLEAASIVDAAIASAKGSPAIAAAARQAAERAVKEAGEALAAAADDAMQFQLVKWRALELDYLLRLDQGRAASDTRLRDALALAEGQKAAAIQAFRQQMEAVEVTHAVALGIKQVSDGKAAAVTRADRPPDLSGDEVASRKHREMVMQARP